ncbi:MULTISPECIES: hypothetical protein [unclassified Methylophaga]|jgi:hypothetical protein|uniref:hypothetical protein n=1 Tax=unclassified Methylophaga TaxID=2629249 RepID=UPI00259CEDFC|nr:MULTISPECIES: hypothetical protein [unclassified Methylophaga]|tara:strand:- start:26367 stop:26684 length:318 start_codon:yes stop_codon:yes gene_type:complete
MAEWMILDDDSIEEWDFIKDIRKQNQYGYEAFVFYIDGEIIVLRSTSPRIHKIETECLIDTFSRYDSEERILNVVEKHIREYEERKAAQSRRLNETLGIFHAGRG